MTDYVTRDDTNLGVGRILTSPTMYALYENPIAIAEGAAGAPRISTKTFIGPNVGGSAKSFTLIPYYEDVDDTGLIYVSSDSGVYDFERAPNFYSVNSHVGVCCLVSGVIRVSYQYRRFGDTGGARVRVLKNGVLVDEQATASNTYQLVSFDISVIVGDTIAFQQRGSGSPAGRSRWRDVEILSDSSALVVAV